MAFIILAASWRQTLGLKVVRILLGMLGDNVVICSSSNIVLSVQCRQRLKEPDPRGKRDLLPARRREGRSESSQTEVSLGTSYLLHGWEGRNIQK